MSLNSDENTFGDSLPPHLGERLASGGCGFREEGCRWVAKQSSQLKAIYCSSVVNKAGTTKSEPLDSPSSRTSLNKSTATMNTRGTKISDAHDLMIVMFQIKTLIDK